jgi:hypothetical protein
MLLEPRNPVPRLRFYDARCGNVEVFTSWVGFSTALDIHIAHALAFVYGDYEDLDPQHAHVYAYTRTLGSDKYLMVENFSSSRVTYTLPNGLKAANLLLSDIPGSDEANVSTLNLAPWESRIYKQ